MKNLTRAEFLATNDLKTEKYEMKAEGYEETLVYVKTLSAREQASFENLAQSKDKHSILANIVVMGICDENGNKLFTEADVDALSNKSAAALIELSNAVIEKNFMTNDDIEDLAKN